MRRIRAISVTLAMALVAAAATASGSEQPVRAARAMHPRQDVSPYKSVGRSMKARDYYQMHWGVDSLVVKSVPADQLIRFSYRVVNAQRAQALGGKEANPLLYDEASRVSLVVPTMDKVGQLRQSGIAQEGKTYWMVFSNKGNVVKVGHRVVVVIGQFHVNGLAVE
ncbi:MAG TPA: hypothetical protein VGI23_02545 [Steroidobacteraceae bacterium]